VLAYYAFYFVDISKFDNRGELLKPMVQVSSLKLKDENNVLVPEDKLTYKWRFISFVNASCDAICSGRLIDSRQIRKSLGKEEHRVLQVIVELAEPDEALAQFIKTELPEAVVLKADAADIAAIMPTPSGSSGNDIYIQDPLGNILMRFKLEQPVVDIQHDIKKLLKVSQIG
jgi:hypothetical protein